MATPFDQYPYTNFHELNLAYFIVHFREIFAQWDELYSDMLEWKEATDADLADWKTGVLSDIDAWETALNTSLDGWKADTESDITGWMNEVIDALDLWKAAFQTLFDSTFSNLSDIKTDAEAARDAAIAAQTAAETAAASVLASAAQIQQNQLDITSLNADLSEVTTRGSTIVAEITKDSPYITEMTQDGARGYIGSNGAFSPNTGYATFLFEIPISGDIWFDTNPGNKSLAVFSGLPVGTSTFVARYRDNDSNLPYEENKLAVTAGQIIAIGVSVNTSTGVYNDFILNVPMYAEIHILTDGTLTQQDVPADAKAVGDAVDDLQSQIDDLDDKMDSLAVFGGATYITVTNDSPEVDEYKENGNRGYINNVGNFVEAAGYATFLYHIPVDGNVWFDITTGNKSIVLFNNNAIGSANFVARYRDNDSNLPYAENKLAVTAGQLIAIGVSVNTSTGVYNEFSVHVPKVNSDILLGDNVKFSASQISDIQKISASEKLIAGTVTIDTGSLIITNGNARYTIARVDDDTIRAHVWRITKGEIWNGSDWYTLWQASDSDGVVRITGEDDFIGGYHGDETSTSWNVFVDGVLINDAYEGSYKEIILYEESDVYHCNTSETPNVVAFKRNKILKFDSEGMHIDNYWVAQESLSMTYAYMGMLSINRYVTGLSGDRLITGYSADNIFKLIDPDTGTQPIADITKVTFSTIYGDASIEMKYITDDADYSCGITDYDTESSQRLKVYAGLRSFSMSADDTIRAEAIIRI